MTWRGVCLAALFCAASSAGWPATRHALLVGVQDYDPSVAAIAPALDGPGNDVELMWHMLREQGVPPDRILILAEPSGDWSNAARARAEPPTRAGILAALDGIAGDVAAGDDVFLFFAGHGGQLPDKAGSGMDDEPDGLDEVFLPADFRIETDGGTVRHVNEIRDDDIGDRIDRMIDRGAHVWLVADTCHAGTLRRDPAPGLVPRQVSFGTGARRVADDAAVLSPPQRDGGAFVAFYGARAGALSYETRVVGADGTARTHGLMSWHLVQAVRAGARDYSGLAMSTAAGVWSASGARADPEFVGALAGVPMFGADARTDGRFRVMATDDGLHIAAGRLDGLSEGQEVALGWNGDPGSDAPLATARVSVLGLDVAELAIPPAGDPSAAGLDTQLVEEGLDPLRHRARWLADRAPALSARMLGAVAPSDDVVRFGPGLPDGSRERQSLEMLLARRAPAWARDTAPPAGVDLVDGRLTLTHGDGTPVLTFPRTPDGVRHLADRLDRLRFSGYLRSVGESLRGTALSSALETGLAIRQDDTAPCATPAAAPARPQGRIVRNCDLVEIGIRNTGARTLDITPLYLAPDGEVYFLGGYSGSAAGGLRLEPRQSDVVVFREDTAPRNGKPAATGTVTLMLLAVAARRDGRAPVDFRYLQTAGDRPLMRTATPDAAAKGAFEAGAALIEIETRPPRAGPGDD